MSVITNAERAPCAPACRPGRRPCAGYPYAWLVIFLVFMVVLRFVPSWGDDQTADLQPVDLLHDPRRRLLLRVRRLGAVRVLAGGVRDGRWVHVGVGDPGGCRLDPRGRARHLRARA